jgi:hypothetical protein
VLLFYERKSKYVVFATVYLDFLALQVLGESDQCPTRDGSESARKARSPGNILPYSGEIHHELHYLRCKGGLRAQRARLDITARMRRL